MNRLILSAIASLAMLLSPAPGASAATSAEDGASQRAANGNSLGWVNQRTGVVGTFTDAAARPNASGRECREYSFTAQIAGSQQEIFGVACREPDGSWQEASESFEPQLEVRSEAPVLESYSTGPPEPSFASYPNAGWDNGYSYQYPRVGLSASYCFAGLCFGSGYSTGFDYGYGYPYYGYPYYGYPYYGYGYYGYPYYGYGRYSYPYYRYRNYGYGNHRNYGHRNYGHRNYGHRNYSNHNYTNHNYSKRNYSKRNYGNHNYGNHNYSKRTSNRQNGQGRRGGQGSQRRSR